MSLGKTTMALALAAVLLALSTAAANAQSMLSDQQLDSIAALLPKMTDNQEKIETLYKLSRQHSEMDSIIKYSLTTYYLAKRHGNTKYVALACEVIGWYYNTIGKFSLSSKYFNEAGEIYAQQGNTIGQAMMLSGSGDAYIGLGKFEEGINNKLKALKLFDENQDLASTALIYRTIGIACTQFQQYKPALEYLDKALENDIKVEHKRGTNRDYFYIGLTINLHSTVSENGSKQLAIQYLTRALRLQEEIDDNIFIIKSCALLSLIYNEMHSNTYNWEYADSSYYYYNKGMAMIENTGYHADDDLYYIARAEHTTMSGNYVSAKQMLLQKLEDPALPSITLNLLNQALKLYFKYNNDYEGLFKLTQRLEIDRKQIYITEFALGLSRFNKSKELEDHLHELTASAESRKQEFESTKFYLTSTRVITIYMLICAIAIIVMFTQQNIKNKQYHKILQHQTDEIQATNEELNALVNEAYQQSNLIKQQTLEMKRQRNKLASINLRIVINLDIASRFQASLMPSQETINKIFKDIFVLWRPLEEVSGDFFWVSEVDGLKFVAAADCTGHGIPGASLSMLGISFLNSIVARINLQQINAAEVLTKLRYRITESLTRGTVNNEDIHDGMDIAVCIFDTKNSKLSYAGAYRPLWIVNNGELTEYKPDKIPIAVDKDRSSAFTNNEIQLQKGDRVYMFTDGITDQFGEREKGKLSKFKPKRLRELICNVSCLDTQSQMREIESTIDQWRGDCEQTDDILVIGIMEA